MKMKVTVLVKDKNNQLIYSEDYFINDKSDIPAISDKVAEKMSELEDKYPYPEYEVEQNISFINE